MVRTSSSSRPIDPALFTWPSASPALLGSKCQGCGAIAFPSRGNCTGCGGTDVVAVELPRRGTLWAWTIQRFMPKSPYHSAENEQTFTPFGVGYIELPGALRVEARLTENDPDKLRTGMAMELEVYSHRVEADGTAVMNYAFKPV